MGAVGVRPAYLLDSVILIDHLRGIEAATDWLAKLEEGEAVISVITRAEVLCGGAPEEVPPATELCDRFECLPLTRDDATEAARMRRDQHMKLPDALQAAAARRHGLKLVTRDVRGFDEKKSSVVLVPYQLK